MAGLMVLRELLAMIFSCVFKISDSVWADRFAPKQLSQIAMNRPNENFIECRPILVGGQMLPSKFSRESDLVV